MPLLGACYRIVKPLQFTLWQGRCNHAKALGATRLDDTCDEQAVHQI